MQVIGEGQSKNLLHLRVWTIISFFNHCYASFTTKKLGVRFWVQGMEIKSFLKARVPPISAGPDRCALAVTPSVCWHRLYNDTNRKFCWKWNKILHYIVGRLWPELQKERKVFKILKKYEMNKIKKYIRYEQNVFKPKGLKKLQD